MGSKLRLLGGASATSVEVMAKAKEQIRKRTMSVAWDLAESIQGNSNALMLLAELCTFAGLDDEFVMSLQEWE